MNVPRVVAGVLVVAVVVTACGGSAPQGEGTRGGVDSPVVAHASDPGGGMEAIVTGVVDFDPEQGCLWLAQPDGTRYPVVWPRGTTGLLDDVEGFTIRLADGRRIHPGDRVTGAGGYLPAETWEQIPARCVQNGEVAVFNARSEITIEEGVGLDLDPRWSGGCRFRPRSLWS